MNLFTVTLTADSTRNIQGIFMDGRSFQVPVPPAKAPPLMPYLNKQVVLGILPENIHDRLYLPPQILAAAIRATVVSLEPAGEKILADVVCGEHKFTVLLDSRTAARSGQTIELVFDMATIQAFDVDTGQELL